MSTQCTKKKWKFVVAAYLDNSVSSRFSNSHFQGMLVASRMLEGA
jgi:hypothetical protein